ncbi:hypothetical protein GUITHDRAFT_154865 [Guillardia theta CCMP2712]|uniref:K Homology domain-containing protein n=2 Tax=Guillardia theta TaxID=55529 RepID=L1IPZ1_GUITC|nr:hypothetical protein GUITHDRAFT_154865 [Guillardia theta CCMP2712]EKX37885.1 hypothetical protein GUITHDRAFT_154865 [Guillardia theta CCMP2712]|eukprot:XP_005824865.1 hypothetical protein GUITHDRAFT_154865 [Guillardia theta CCMP2712]
MAAPAPVPAAPNGVQMSDNMAQPQQQQQQQQQPQKERPAEIYQSIPIPAERVGWIIGKQGAYIQNLEKRSGCSISVSDNPCKEFGREWNYVQLQGSTRSVDKAKKLIYMRLESFRAT